MTRTEPLQLMWWSTSSPKREIFHHSQQPLKQFQQANNIYKLFYKYYFIN